MIHVIAGVRTTYIKTGSGKMYDIKLIVIYSSFSFGYLTCVNDWIRLSLTMPEKSLGRRRFAPRNELIRTDFVSANAVRHITQLVWRVSSWMRIRIDFLLDRREKFHLERQFWNVLRAAINHDDCWSWSKMIDHCCFRRNTLYGDFLMMEWRSRDHLFL